MLPEEFIKTYEKALATQEWANIDPLIAEDAAVTFSNGVVHQGKMAIKKAYEKNFSLIQNENYSVSNVRWIKEETSFAVYLFDFEWDGIFHGKPASGRGIGTSIIIKESQNWILMAEHLGRNSKSE